MARTQRGAAAAVTLFALVALVAPAEETGSTAAGPTGVQLAAVIGLGYDGETAEYSPVRCMLGLGLSGRAVRVGLFADCGIPWEPSVRVDAIFTIVDLSALRLDAHGRLSARAYGGVATELAGSTGALLEIGPRRLSLATAVGLSVRATWYEAIDGWLSDLIPWARVGVAWRPGEAARLELAIASDAPLALWLRTSFELSGSWRLASGITIEGMLAARYSDLFTLTGYLDGLDLRAAVSVPIGGGDR